MFLATYIRMKLFRVYLVQISIENLSYICLNVVFYMYVFSVNNLSSLSTVLSLSNHAHSPFKVWVWGLLLMVYLANSDGRN